jgi:hypothetical protein
MSTNTMEKDNLVVSTRLRGSHLVEPGAFEPSRHWYDKALNAQIHPLVHFFLGLSTEQIVTRYCHLHPKSDARVLHNWLLYEPRFIPWSGADLFHVTSASGTRQMVVVEVNSCPSGQKSMPLYSDNLEQGGYRKLIEETFKQKLQKRRRLPEGGLAVLYDKNYMGSSGYAAAMADVFQEPVHLVPCFADDWSDHVEYRDRALFIRDEKSNWVPIRAAFRYVTERPWNRIPMGCKSMIFNPIVACLAGGRNKLIAAKAYDFMNAQLEPHGLSICTPHTFWDVSHAELRLWVERLGGKAVIKVPYSNAGQGVFTIVNERELAQLEDKDFPYKQFIVQSLIGNLEWSSGVGEEKLYHIGTLPGKSCQTFAADIRMMIHHTPLGFRPLALYSRRARMPLASKIADGSSSWDMLGTNLSTLTPDGNWASDTSRLLLVDRRDFNKLGVGLDDLIDGFIQSVLSTIAIDLMAKRIVGERGQLKTKLFRSLNPDTSLLQEIYGAI